MLFRSEKQNSTLRMKLLHSNPNATATGLAKQEGVVNYLVGRDSSKWHSNIPTYGKVRYANVYRGIDLVYYGNSTKLEYDFVVSPNADASVIGLDFSGAKRVQLTSDGGLSLELGSERMDWGKPLVYQECDGKRVAVVGRYVSRGGSKVGIEVGKYDHSLPLVIDPILQYSVKFGSTGADIPVAFTVDTKGCAYVIGTTDSANFPTTAGAYRTKYKGPSLEAFITKFSADGQSVVYSTFYGSGIEITKINGATYANEYSHDVAVDGNGNAYIVGATSSTSFPVTSRAYQKKNAGEWNA